ncbi:VOC family protein [Amycolatopsis sp. NBC_01286]|uniref:VOC family protein n=1 Tax=Amycolatopsis sp. NBC_01286 TaxID=2903560 RepID=UPI002E0D869E|nr:VOC family protein [Amycolatopsis sp. NBC_01286]
MGVELNHTIVWASDREASAGFLAGILGLPVGPVAGPFRQLRLANGVTLDFAMAEGAVQGQHYAFLVGDGEFDAALARLRASGTPFWADPFHRVPDEINHELGGRGVYFADPDGHNLELLTRA